MARRTWALSGAAFFALLVAAAWAGLHAIADPAALRQMVHDKAMQAFSRDLTARDVALELLPSPSLVARNMSMRSPDASAQPELAARSARAFIALAPLFSGKVTFDSYEVEDADWQLGKGLWHVDHLRVSTDEAMRSFHVQASGRAHGDAGANATKVDARIDANPSHDQFEVHDATLDLGALHMQGNARISTRAHTVEARIVGGRLDWAQALVDSGHPRLAPLPPDQVFRDTPLAWPLLQAMSGWRGSVDADFDSVRTANGIELQHFTTRSTFEGERWTMHDFAMGMLGGTAKGSLDLDGARHSARLRFDGDGLLLERWFHERRSQIPFHGGPMRIKADLAATGESLRDLAARMSGNATIRMGAGVLENAKAGAAEAKLTGDDASAVDAIRFSCAAGDFPFHAGRAVRSPLVAARSDVAWLVTSGNVDFRSDTLELRGRVKTLAPHVGTSVIAGDVLISGKLRHPHIQHDPSRTAAAVARVGAALATLGLSAVATASEDAAAGHENDPCTAVF